MWNRRVWRVAFWLGCLAIGCLLVPALSRATLGRQAPVSAGSAAVLGVTPTKVLEFAPKSVRDPDYPHEAARDATGDTYNAAGLVQDAVSAYYVDDEPDAHTFDTGGESAGANLLSGVETRIVGTDFGPGVPGTNFFQVNYFTVDGSDIVPLGSVSPDGSVFDTWRLDVGAGAAGTDQINWTPNPGFTVVDSGFCVFDDGVAIGCFSLALDESGVDGVAGIGLVGLGGADIAGFGLDEMAMFWVIQLNPSCGDGFQDAGEACDDGNVDNGDGCSATCTLEDVLFGDADLDGDVDLFDMAVILNNMTGPTAP